ncbi:unnamed protein product [Sphagnum jensenii]|uniref:eIF3a PCI domain-containing protein n=2 Tax=Sphagnum jensenii TaxID=128206 RepID=A0ABP1A1K7_9BRYO
MAEISVGDIPRGSGAATQTSKLEKVYHKICEKAFKFCQDYSRTMEFRRLCEMLRNHLRNMQSATLKGQKIPWEWTSDIVELHLQTRFSQLEVAVNLELWNEGFRTVEDIHAITVAGRKTPKPKLMAVFYEKLTRIFWVAGNHLFHAFSWFRYFSLTLECRKDLKHDERSLMASYVLLSALTIPMLKDSGDVAAQAADDELVIERNQQMAALLDFQTHPSRGALLDDLAAKRVTADVFPELACLHELLDVKFHPLGLVKSVAPVLAFVKQHPLLAMYSLPLQRIVVLRVVKQLSRVYSVLKLDFLLQLLKPLEGHQRRSRGEDSCGRSRSPRAAADQSITPLAAFASREPPAARSSRARSRSSAPISALSTFHWLWWTPSKRKQAEQHSWNRSARKPSRSTPLC